MLISQYKITDRYNQDDKNHHNYIHICFCQIVISNNPWVSCQTWKEKKKHSENELR